MNDTEFHAFMTRLGYSLMENGSTWIKMTTWQIGSPALYWETTKKTPKRGTENYGFSLAASKVLGILVFIKKVVEVHLELSS